VKKMHYLPENIKKLVDHFDKLPGIGPKHATRLSLYLLDRKDFAEKFAADIGQALASIKLCEDCQNLSSQTLCFICSDKNRDHQTICVIANIQDIEPIERTEKFSGVYHILHGMVNPIEGITPDQVKIKELFDRIKKNNVKEVILALDATSEGEATALYLTQKINAKIIVTKLARGIPMGSSIEYADEVTLSSALENRK
jgi:recombination protein RecR